MCNIYFSLFQINFFRINVLEAPFYFRFEIKTVYRHLNVRFMIIERTKLSIALENLEQPLVNVIMICLSLTVSLLVILVTPTNSRQAINMALHKPKLCWQAASTWNQQKLKFFVVVFKISIFHKGNSDKGMLWTTLILWFK